MVSQYLDMDNIACLEEFYSDLCKGNAVDEVKVIGWSKGSQMIKIKNILQKIAEKRLFLSNLVLHSHNHILLLKYIKCKSLVIDTDRIEVSNLRKLTHEEGTILTAFLKNRNKACESIKISLHFNEGGDSVMTYRSVLKAVKHAKDVNLELDFDSSIYDENLSKDELSLLKRLSCSKLLLIEVSGNKRMKNWRYLSVKLKVEILEINLVDIAHNFLIYASILNIVSVVNFLTYISNVGEKDLALHINLMYYSKRVKSVIDFKYISHSNKSILSVDKIFKCRLQAMISFLFKENSPLDLSFRRVVSRRDTSIKEYLQLLSKTRGKRLD